MSDGRRTGTVLAIVALVAIAIAQLLVYPESGVNPGMVMAAVLLLIMLFAPSPRAPAGGAGKRGDPLVDAAAVREEGR